jgi:HAMP domain-containing protein
VGELNDLVESNLGILAGVLAGACVLLLLLLIVVVIQIRRAGRLERRLDSLTRGVETGNLESVMSTHLDTLQRVAGDLSALTGRTAALEHAARGHLARVGLVRFNPFEDTGGNQSFALAMLDDTDSGVVVSSLHSRSTTRVYAKAIVEGRCDTALSAEEAQAVAQAVERARREKKASAAAARRASGSDSSGKPSPGS